MKHKLQRIYQKAVLFYNQLQKRKLLANKLAAESKLVQKESMKLLAEFEKMDNKGPAQAIM